MWAQVASSGPKDYVFNYSSLGSIICTLFRSTPQVVIITTYTT